MIFRHVLDRNGGTDPWELSHVEFGGVGGTRHDRDFVLLEALTLGRFTLTHSMRFRYAHFHSIESFIGVVRERYERRLGTGRAFGWSGDGDPWAEPLVVERFMSEVVDHCERRSVWYHPGWLKILCELRAEIRRQTVSQCGGDGHD
jgi:hypothetical protein